MQAAARAPSLLLHQEPAARAAALRTRAILPRLDLARGAVGGLLSSMRRERDLVRRRNAARAPGPARAAREGIEREMLLRVSVHVTRHMQRRLARLTLLRRAPEVLPPMIPAARGLSSALHAAYPGYSALLCEVSSILGSVMADSASMTGASCDFGRHNLESAALLDEAKLIACSKLSELYPNLALRIQDTG